MTSLLIIPILWCAASTGRALCRAAGLPASATLLETMLLSTGTGMALLAYGVLGIGLVGLLTPAAIAIVIVLLGLIGIKEHAPMARDLIKSVSQPYKVSPSARGLSLVVFLVAAALAVLALIGCFTPPTVAIRGTGYTEWDSLAYHLADPKIYLQHHRIIFIPWESHSNFAFTAEMWFAVGLAFHSVALAKLFHFTCGLGACLTTYAIGRRCFNPTIGTVAALMLAGSAPVLSEAGMAYVDLAATFYTALTLLCLLSALRENESRWLMPFAAVMMGFTLSCKALALTSLVMFAAAVLVWLIVRQKRSIPEAIMHAAGWCVIAFVVGCPWYVKSFIYTGDPFFPFGWAVFHNSHWNATNAAAYTASNMAFGMGHKPADLLFAPWNLTMYPVPGHAPGSYPYLNIPPASVQPFNNFATELLAVPAIFLVGAVAMLFLRLPGVIKLLCGYAALSFLLWFASMQYIRYLLPLFPMLALISAWATVQLIESRRFSGYALAALAGFTLMFTVVNGLNLAIKEFPVATGQQSQSDFLTQTDGTSYAAMSYINSSLPKDATVVFYGEPFGFYCERNYLWGEAGHSTYIPYSTFHSAADLDRWFVLNKVNYILVNNNAAWFTMSPTAQDYTGWVYDLTEGSGPPIYQGGSIGIWAVPQPPGS